MQPTGKDFMYGGNNGTGAYIFDTSNKKPLDVHLDMMDKVANVKAKKDAQKAAEKKKLDDELSKFELNPEGAWQYDIEDINNGINSLHTDFANSLRQGINPEGSPEYGSKKRDIEAQVLTSKQQQGIWGEAQEALYLDKDGTNDIYDFDKSVERLKLYPTLSMEERKEFGEILVPKGKTVDYYVNKAFKELKPDQSAKSYQTGTQHGVINVSEITPEKFSSSMGAALKNDEEFYDLVVEEMGSLPPSVQKTVADRVAAKAAKGEFVTPEQEYLNMSRSHLLYREEKKTSSNNPNAGRNYDREKIKPAVYHYVDNYSLMMNGDSDVFTKSADGDYSTYTGEYFLNTKIGNIAVANTDKAIILSLNDSELADLGLNRFDIEASESGEELKLDDRILDIREKDGVVTIKTTQSLINSKKNKGSSEYIPATNMDFLFSAIENSTMFKGHTQEAASIANDYATSKGAMNEGRLNTEVIVSSKNKTPKQAGSEITNNVIYNGIPDYSTYEQIVTQYKNGDIELNNSQIREIVESFNNSNLDIPREVRKERGGPVIKGDASDFGSTSIWDDI